VSLSKFAYRENCMGQAAPLSAEVVESSAWIVGIPMLFELKIRMASHS